MHIIQQLSFNGVYILSITIMSLCLLLYLTSGLSKSCSILLISQEKWRRVPRKPINFHISLQIWLWFTVEEGMQKKNNKKNLYNSTNTYNIAIVHSYNFYIYIKKKIKNILINICTQNETKKSKKINLMKKMEMMTMIWFKRKYGT